jgi:DNA-binding NtrC family response regulator
MHGKKIIVIDDEPDIRSLVSDILSPSHYDIMELETVDEVIEHCKYNSVDLIITDLFMPDKTGLDLIEIIKNKHNNIKVLAISGGNRLRSCDFLPVAEIIGAHETLKKPFTLTELREKVAELLN